MKTKELRNFDYCNRTDVGKLRERNEDYQAYFDSVNGHIFVVCDGMGGHAGGSEASQIAVESIAYFFSQNYYPDPFDAIQQAIVFANEEIFKYARKNIELYGMGTTIVLALIRDNLIYYGHVGDSRIYYYFDQRLEQITEDHSFVQGLINLGAITKEEAEEHPRRNELSRALGIEPVVQPSICIMPAMPDNDGILLLCTDGLTNMLTDKEIEDSLRADLSLDEKGDLLIEKANDQGGNDNITLSLVKFHNLYVANREQIRTKDEITGSHWPRPLKIASIASIILVIIALGVFAVWGFYEPSKEQLDPKKNNADTELQRDTFVLFTIDEQFDLDQVMDNFSMNDSLIHLYNQNKIWSTGDTIKIPIQAIHTVSDGESFLSLEELYNVGRIQIMQANDYCSHELQDGKVLYIPLANKEIK